MRVVLQRVESASVRVNGRSIGSIQSGLLLLVGVTGGDGQEEIGYLVNKIANLRVFPDELGKMNRSLLDLEKELLIVSQFTLYGDVRKGRRPSFIRAEEPVLAQQVIADFVERFQRLNLKVKTGLFGAEMAVELVNDGPVTIWLDTEDLIRRNR